MIRLVPQLQFEKKTYVSSRLSRAADCQSHLQLLGYLTAVSAALCRRAERLRSEQFGFLQQGPSGPLGGTVMRAGGDRVGASVHHAGVEAAGHGEGLEVGLESQRQREFVDQVDRSAGHDAAAAKILETQH